MSQLRDGVAEYIANRFYERPSWRDAWLLTYAEGLVYCTLQSNFPQSGWRPAAAGDPWDLENDDGIQLQVKHSAALQPGVNGENPGRRQSLSFDIHPGEQGRQTHIYIFAWHPESAPDVADLRDTGQWRFCVMPEDELPGCGRGAKDSTHIPEPGKIHCRKRWIGNSQLRPVGRYHKPHR